VSNNQAAKEGYLAGREDALAGRRSNPLPDPLAVQLSKGYRVEFAKFYDLGFDRGLTEKLLIEQRVQDQLEGRSRD